MENDPNNQNNSPSEEPLNDFILLEEAQDISNPEEEMPLTMDEKMDRETVIGGYTLSEREELLGDSKKDKASSAKKTHPKTGSSKPIALILSLVLLSSACGFGGGFLALKFLPGLIGPTTSPINISAQGQDIDLATAIAEKNMQSVVGIKTDVVTSNPFFGQQVNQGVGTGVIVDSQGYILTNSHVIEDGSAAKITVELFGGKETQATLLWNDTLLDLAVIKINEQGLIPAELGDSDAVKIGATTFAIGNPLGLTFERTITDGIISGLNRSIAVSQTQNIDGLMQTNASINPGNSGGPLLDKEGKVIGITTAKIQTAEGLGFAIPINIAKPIMEQIIEKGEFRKSYLGISGIDVPTMVKYSNVDLGIQTGAYVESIYANSPASAAGLQPGDVIIGINETKVESMSALQKKLYEYRPGDTVSLEVVRNKKTIKIDAILSDTMGTVG